MGNFWIVPLLHSVSIWSKQTKITMIIKIRECYTEGNTHTTSEYISINAQNVLVNHNVRANRLPTVCDLFVHMSIYYVWYKAM